MQLRLPDTSMMHMMIVKRKRLARCSSLPHPTKARDTTNALLTGVTTPQPLKSPTQPCYES